ncbi:Uncharacterized protein SCF082_LOCUS40690 [Durusdinium trenchii]|uniref:Uncharacterized protein n=2 Tax=Durusdinium trenchii TaxID=1381693 RepID=A0ABP0QCH8_9DINO
MGDILLASDEENEGSSHAQGIARGLPPAHRHVEIQTLLGRPCRCNRATCFQQFAGQEQQVSAKRSEFTSLSPEDRALCLQQQTDVGETAGNDSDDSSVLPASEAESVLKATDEENEPHESVAEPGSEDIFLASDEENQQPRSQNRRRASQASFLGKPVCIHALQALLGIGTSTIQRLRAGERAFTNSRRPSRQKHPTFGFALDHNSSAMWPGIVMFLWETYQSCAEVLPTVFKMPKETEVQVPEHRDPDLEERLVNHFVRSLESYTSDPDVHMVGPGTFAGPCHEDLDQLFSQQAALICRHTFDTPDEVVDIMDSMGRPRDAAERERKRSKVVKVEAFASKLDETADWKSWVRQVGTVGQIRVARRGDVDPTSLGACAVEEIPGRSARAGDLILVVKRRMANAEPFTVLLAMTEERAADLEAGFQQPTSEASRRPISMQVRKNILAYAPRTAANDASDDILLASDAEQSHATPLENNETESEILRASDAEPEAPLSPKPELKMDSISAAWLTVRLVSGAGLNFFFWVQPQGDGCTSETNEVCSFVNKFLQVPDVKNAFFSTCNALAEKHGGHVEVPVASACSGLGVAEMVFENLNTALSEMANLNSSKFSYLKTEFTCEIEKWKAQFISEAFQPKYVFEDMRSLGSGRAKDINRGTYHSVPKVKGMTMGFPCTSVSSQNTSPKSFSDPSSATGGGFQSLLSYCDYNDELEWVITENVRNLLHKRSQFGNEVPINIMDSEMSKRGFLPCHQLVTSLDYGAPQSRNRVWCLYIKSKCLKECCPDPLNLFNMLACRPPSMKYILDKELLPSDDFARSSYKSRKSGKSGGEKWKDGFKEMQKKLGKAAVMRNYNLLKELVMPLTLREVSILAVAVTMLQSSGINPFETEVIVQVDQNYERNTYHRSNPLVSPCIIPHGKYAVTGQWRLLSGQEKLLLQGLGTEDILRYGLNKLTDANQSDLAGNSFTVSICAAAILATISSWQP